MFNQDRVAGRHKKLLKLRVLSKLGEACIEHRLDFNLLPVGADLGGFAGTSHFRGFAGSRRVTNQLAPFRVTGLHSLEIVLRRRPGLTGKNEWSTEEVAQKASLFVAVAVEING